MSTIPSSPPTQNPSIRATVRNFITTHTHPEALANALTDYIMTSYGLQQQLISALQETNALAKTANKLQQECMDQLRMVVEQKNEVVQLLSKKIEGLQIALGECLGVKDGEGEGEGEGGEQ